MKNSIPKLSNCLKKLDFAVVIMRKLCDLAVIPEP